MNKKIRSECRFYEKKYLGVMGEYMSVRPVPDHDDSLGYTSQKGGIYVTFQDRNLKDIPEKKRSFFRMGIFTHEMLHQYFTDFKTHKKIGDSYKSNEKRVFYLIANILEDPAIEYWAKSVIGGILIKSLKYTIAQVYKTSPSIEKSTTAFQQYANALIQVGDMGPVKGSFTFPEAEKTFNETIHLFFKGIHESNPTKRIYIAKELTEATRPLWEPLTSDDIDNIAYDYMSSHSGMNGEGSGAEGTENDENSSKEKARRKIIEKINKSSEKNSDDETIAENQNSENKKASSDKNNNNKSTNEDDVENENNDGTQTSDGKSTTSSSDENPSSEDEQNFSSECSDNKQPSQNSNLDTKAKNFGNCTENNNSFDEDCIDEDEYEISSDDIETLQKELEKMSSELEQEDNSDKDSKLDDIEDFDITSPKMPKKTCLNRKILNDSELLANLYSAVVTKHLTAIKSSVSCLRRVFKNDQSEKKNTSTGNVNCRRASLKNSSRVFYKHTENSNKSNSAIFIAVDESLSMNHQSRYISARETCICLAEIFGTLDIPVYVMGFSADTMGYDVIHDHFLRWSTKPKDRYPLMYIGCHMDNCDGYSIRYATELLKKRQAEHKLLIVISDGRPAALNYPNGVSDTADAIRDAKKFSDVLGVNIGDDDAETIRNMYGLDFMKISSVNELFNELNKKLIKIIKGW